MLWIGLGFINRIVGCIRITFDNYPYPLSLDKLKRTSGKVSSWPTYPVSESFESSALHFAFSNLSNCYKDFRVRLTRNRANLLQNDRYHQTKTYPLHIPTQTSSPYCKSSWTKHKSCSLVAFASNLQKPRVTWKDGQNFVKDVQWLGSMGILLFILRIQTFSF